MKVPTFCIACNDYLGEIELTPTLEQELCGEIAYRDCDKPRNEFGCCEVQS